MAAAAKPRDNGVDVELYAEHVWPEPPQRPAVDRQHRAVPLHRLERVAAQHEPRTSDARRPSRLHAPAPVHPEVTADDEPALEAQQQVLPDRFDRLEHAAVDRLRDPGGLPARIRRARLDPLADERLQAPRCAVERITLGHVRRVAPPGYCDGMANAGTVTVRAPLPGSIKAAVAGRARRNDETDRAVFARLTNLVTELLDVEASLLLIADEEDLIVAGHSGPENPWADLRRLPISQAYCQYSLESRAAFMVEDSRTNPLVRDLHSTTDLGVVAYLGVPLLTSEGEPIGSLCAIDVAPRKWTDAEIRVVEDLAATVVAYIEARPRPAATSVRAGGLNIAAVAHRTGVAADTLRKWERRYGVLRPSRTSGGQRRYDDNDVSRVEWLRDRLAEGFRIGAAAALLEPTTDASAETPEQLSRALIEAAREGDPVRLFGLVEQVFTLHPFAVAVEEIVTPALSAIDAGAVDACAPDAPASYSPDTIAEEHLLSATVRSRLERMLSDRRADVRGKAVLACATEEPHELGLLALAVSLQADGWLVAHLGAALPLDAVFSLARRIEADVVCVSVTLPESLEHLAAELESAPEDGPLVIVGGQGVAGSSTELRARVLEGSLTDIVAQVRPG